MRKKLIRAHNTKMEIKYKTNKTCASLMQAKPIGVCEKNEWE